MQAAPKQLAVLIGQWPLQEPLSCSEGDCGRKAAMLVKVFAAYKFLITREKKKNTAKDIQAKFNSYIANNAI